MSQTAPPGMVICPGCGCPSPKDNVFCSHPECHKALGEFTYVLEELRSEARWHEALAENVTRFVAKPGFISAHVLWFVIWIALNTGLLVMVRRFDPPPYSILATVVAVESILMTIFILISQARQNAHADKRAELDYEVNVRTYRTINHIEASLVEISDRLQRLERS